MAYRFDSPDGLDDEIKRELRRLKDSDRSCFMAFYIAMEKITLVGINRSERLETLDGLYDTYSFPLEGCKHDTEIVLSRRIGEEAYTYLGLMFGLFNPKEAAYVLACNIHNLKSPERMENHEL